MLPLLTALALAMAGCKPEKTAEAPQPRPVRSVIAEKSELGQSVVLTGQILAEKELALAFRIGGRIIERKADVGNRVTPNQVLAKLDPQNELNGLRSARAALSAAEGKLSQDSNNFERQQTLLNRGFTTRVVSGANPKAVR
jgi:multidrug efflux pump subunit AcrA (membrane-fusion protein)